jgi:hypothetical protein
MPPRKSFWKIGESKFHASLTRASDTFSSNGRMQEMIEIGARAHKFILSRTRANPLDPTGLGPTALLAQQIVYTAGTVCFFEIVCVTLL